MQLFPKHHRGATARRYFVTLTVLHDRFKIVVKDFNFMIQEGTACRFDEPRASPLNLVLKKTDCWHPYEDYRVLIVRTIPNRYTVRIIPNFANQIRGHAMFSVIDLVKAYTQIPVNLDDISKTPVSTIFRFFEFPFTTFGLYNARQTFQRFIDEVLNELDFCFTYIDDILVSSLNAKSVTNSFGLSFKS